MPAEQPNADDAADLKAIRHHGRKQVASFLPFVATAVVVWWFAYHWLEHSYALDTATASSLTIIAACSLVFAVVKLTGIGIYKSSPLTLQQQALVRVLRQRRLLKKQGWSIFSLVALILCYSVITLLQSDWDRSTAWTLASVIAFFAAADGMTASAYCIDTDPKTLSKHLQANRLGFLTITGLGACLFVWNTYSPGSSARFLPIVLLVGLLVVEVQLAGGSGSQPEETRASPFPEKIDATGVMKSTRS